MAKNIWEDNIWGDRSALLMHELDDSSDYDMFGEETDGANEALRTLLNDNPNLLQKVVGGKYKTSAKRDIKNYNKHIAKNARNAYDTSIKKAEKIHGKSWDKLTASDIAGNPTTSDYIKQQWDRMKKTGDFEGYAKKHNPLVHSAVQGNIQWDDSKGLMYETKSGGLKPLSGAQYSGQGALSLENIFGGDYFNMKERKDEAGKSILSDPDPGGAYRGKTYTISPKNQDYLDFTYDAGGGLFEPLKKAGGAIKDWMKSQKGYEPSSAVYRYGQGQKPPPSTTPVQTNQQKAKDLSLDIYNRFLKTNLQKNKNTDTRFKFQKDLYYTPSKKKPTLYSSKKDSFPSQPYQSIRW